MKDCAWIAFAAVLLSIVGSCAMESKLDSRRWDGDGGDTGNGRCTESTTCCMDDSVHMCREGRWVLWDDCVVQGLQCATIQGDAVCDNTPFNFSDRDSETESDSEQSPSPNYYINIMPSDTGWLDKTDNSLGLQGMWYAKGCEGSVIEPAAGSLLYNDGSLCFSGTAPRIVDLNNDGSPDRETLWGAAVGFDVCTPDDSDASLPLGACPFNSELSEKMVGVALAIDGVVNAPELRIVFRETDGEHHAYVPIQSTEVHKFFFEALFTEAGYFVDQTLKPNGVIPASITAIEIHIPADEATNVSWDVCIDAAFAITR